MLYHNMDYWSGVHTKHRLVAHVVFIPKYRRHVLTGPLGEFVRRSLLALDEANRWLVTEINVQEDHVHLLLQYGVRESLAQVVQQLKGVTSLRLAREIPGLSAGLARHGFWARGYFASSVGPMTETAVRRYIREQPGKRKASPPPAG